MIVTPLHTERIRTLDEVRASLEGSEAVDFAVSDRAAIYRLIRRMLARLEYYCLGKPDRELAKHFLDKEAERLGKNLDGISAAALRC